MQLDDLKEAWAAHGALLERSLAIDERLLRDLLLRKVRFALAPYVVARALEVSLGIATLGFVLPVLARHLGEPRYVVAGGAAALFAVGVTALSAQLLVRALQLDYGGQVTAIRRAIERLRLAEYRAQKWALLGGVVVWLPTLLVLFEVLTGLAPLAHIDLAFLVANLAFGVALLIVGQVLSRKHVERDDLGPWALRVVDALSGRGLRVAASHLAELESFEREEPTAA